MELHGQLLDVRGAARLPAVLVFLRGAVPLRERQEAPAERMTDELEQDEQIARTIGERRSRQQEHRVVGHLPARLPIDALAKVGLSTGALAKVGKLPRELAAVAGV